MQKLTDAIRRREEKKMETAQTFATKEEALKAAVKANIKTGDFTSVWKAKDSNKYTVVTTETRESALRLEYEEVVNIFEVGRIVKTQYDEIKEM